MQQIEKRGRGRPRKYKKEEKSKEQEREPEPSPSRSKSKSPINLKSKGIKQSISTHKQQPPKQLTLPYQITTSICRRRPIALKKGYYRHQSKICLRSGKIELTTQDIDCIKNEKQTHKLTTTSNGDQQIYYLMNKDQLMRLYTYLEENIPHKETNQYIIKPVIEKYLLQFDLRTCQTIYQICQEEQPQLFQSFVNQLIGLWNFRCNSDQYYRVNEPHQTQLVNKMYKPYSVRVKHQNKDKKLTYVQLKSRERAFVSEITDLWQEYQHKSAAFQKRKNKLVQILVQYVKVLSTHSGVEFEPFIKNIEDLTLEEVEKKLIEVITKLKKWKSEHEHEHQIEQKKQPKPKDKSKKKKH